MFSKRSRLGLAGAGAVLALAAPSYLSAQEPEGNPYKSAIVAEVPEGLPIEAPAGPPEDPPADPPEEDGFTCAGEFYLNPKIRNRFNSGFTSAEGKPIIKGSVTINCGGIYASYEPIWGLQRGELYEAASILGLELPAWETKFGDFSLGAEHTWVRLHKVPDNVDDADDADPSVNTVDLDDVNGVDPTINTLDLYASYSFPGKLRIYGLGIVSCEYTRRTDDEGTMYQCGYSTLFPPIVEMYGFDITPQLSANIACMDGLFGHKKCPTNVKGGIGVTASREIGDIVVTFGAKVDRHWGYGELEEGGFGDAWVGSGFVKFSVPDLLDLVRD
jgi:hypothetical protein